MNRACAVTGHRDLPVGFDENHVYDGLEELILQGYDTFFCGMAEGFDLLALSCLVGLKRKYRIYVEACIPYDGQEIRYSAENRRKYRELLEWCDRKTVLFEGYRNGCFLARDRYMVDCADLVFAYCTKNTGGTAYTVRYAADKNVPVLFL